jgi:hypothetical protein
VIAVGAGPQKHHTVQQQPAAGSCHYRLEHGEPLKDPTCTPGAISPAVTQANLKSTICRKGGYTSGVRPSAYVTGKEKKLNAASYGYTGRMGDAEYDHLSACSSAATRTIRGTCGWSRPTPATRRVPG